MAATLSGRLSAAKTGWVIGLLFAAWMAFLFVPLPFREKTAPVSALAPMSARSRLEEVGLANNPDWVGLPDFFHVWAGTLDWSEGRVVFAYWNPGAQRYADFFSAVRQGSDYRFRALSRQQVMAWATEFFPEGEEQVANALSASVPPATHPFVFLTRPVVTPPGHSAAEPHAGVRRATPPPAKIEVELGAPSSRPLPPLAVTNVPKP